MNLLAACISVEQDAPRQQDRLWSDPVEEILARTTEDIPEAHMQTIRKVQEKWNDGDVDSTVVVYMVIAIAEDDFYWEDWL